MLLTSSNYYETDTDWEYQSPTIFKEFLKCEAAALAHLKGEFDPFLDSKEDLLVGNYLHSYFESEEAHKAFIKGKGKHLFTQQGDLKAKFKRADVMIEKLENDDHFKPLYQGEKEVIVTGNIFGIEWKGKVDNLNLKKQMFVDLKTTQAIHKREWNADYTDKETFVASWNYQLQMFVYKELIRQTFGVDCTPYIVGISKQKYPEVALIDINNKRMTEARQQIEEFQPHIEAVKNGIEKPTACGGCDYCRSQSKLGKIWDMDEL